MNYTEVVNLALSYSDRSDAEVTDRMDDFLRMVESRVNRLLKTQDMAVRSLLQTIDEQEYYTLPSDYSGLRDIELRPSQNSRSRNTLQYLSPEQLNNRSSMPDKGSSSVYYTIVAGQIQIMPPQPDGKILEIIYYRKLLPLNDAQPNNWLSDSNPDTYVMGLLVEISAFVKDAEAKILWDQRFKESIAEISLDDSDSRWAGTALQTRAG